MPDSFCLGARADRPQQFGLLNRAAHLILAAILGFLW